MFLRRVDLDGLDESLVLEVEEEDEEDVELEVDLELDKDVSTTTEEEGTILDVEDADGCDRICVTLD